MNNQATTRHCAVLVVDDSSEMRDMLNAALHVDGYQVQAVRDGTEALIALSEQHFDAVVTDMWMPDMNGAQLVAEVRANPDSSDLYMVLMSGSFDKGFPKDVDADAFLKKPFAIRPLLELLEKIPCRPIA